MIAMQNENTSQESKLYELGYHIIPTIAAEAIGEETAKIKEIIASQGGVIVSESMPDLIDLAYPLSKITDNKRKAYESAYFGWVTFTGDPQAAVAIDKDIVGVDAVLRYLIVKTTPEAASAAMEKMAFLSSKSKKRDEAPAEAAVPAESVGVTASPADAEIDKKIDALLAE